MKTTFSIWYMRPEWFPQGILGAKPNPRKLTETHVHLKDLTVVGGVQQMEVAFARMQGESWSPNGEACLLIEAKGLQHTSMSVGDVIVRDGVAYVVATVGFDRLGKTGGQVIDLMPALKRSLKQEDRP
jgi:hypothetical protein